MLIKLPTQFCRKKKGICDLPKGKKKKTYNQIKKKKKKKKKPIAVFLKCGCRLRTYSLVC